MKKFIIAIAAVAVGFVQANAMSHERAQAEALFLTDKMAYELNLTNAQYDAVYEINYDYFVSLVGTSDILGIFWNRRERELEWVLTSRQYRLYLATTYFYKPVGVYNNTFRFAIYDRYAFDRFYKPVRMVHKIYHGGHAYKAPAHKNNHGNGLAHNGHHGGAAPAAKPDGNHKPGDVAPNNGGHKPSGNHNGNVGGNNKPAGGNHNGGGKVAPNVKPNNGGSKPSGNHNGNVGGNSKPAGGNTGAKASGSTARRTTSAGGTSPASRASSTGRTSNATRR